MVGTRNAHCPSCDAEVEAIKTVAHQSDICQQCGADIPDEREPAE